MRRSVLLAMSFVLAAAGAARAQDPPPATPARMFEAGNYEGAAGTVQQRLAESGEVAAGDIYWAAQALLRSDRGAEAVALLERLPENEDDPWSAVKRSAVLLAQGDREAAVRHATRAAELAPDLFFAHYQLGRARHEGQQWPEAAAAFSRAAEIDGSSAYAHYYAGMAYNRLKRIDPMVVHFRRFLDLAPGAPEHDQVEQLLKLLKGIR